MEKKSLLQKYGIPISHLDFEYVKKCTKPKEMERIVAILRSGEEGYYPDLTKCAEEKLKELNPSSPALRTEERALTKNSFCSKDWQEINEPISEWSSEIKSKDMVLQKIKDSLEDDDEIPLPPIRKGGKLGANNKPESKDVVVTRKSGASVAATNYRQWDKYDADAELLKMDLEVERNKEEVERMNRINKQKSSAKIEVLEEKKNIYEKLLPVEMEKLAEEFKIRGNEYFKAKEYENALEQYSQCLEVQPSVAAFNNRAIANLKLKKYADALSDCNECLQRDDTNLKAWLRKAEAYLGLDKKHEAYRTYEKVKLIDPSNAVACKGLESLKKELGEVAPLSATRLEIMECNSSTEKATVKPKTMQKPQLQLQPQPKPKPKDYDLAELVKPNKLVKNTLMKTMENFGKLTTGEKGKPLPVKPPQNSPPEFKLRIEDKSRESTGKLLIQEI